MLSSVESSYEFHPLCPDAICLRCHFIADSASIPQICLFGRFCAGALELGDCRLAVSPQVADAPGRAAQSRPVFRAAAERARLPALGLGNFLLGMLPAVFAVALDEFRNFHILPLETASKAVIYKRFLRICSFWRSGVFSRERGISSANQPF